MLWACHIFVAIGPYGPVKHSQKSMTGMIEQNAIETIEVGKKPDTQERDTAKGRVLGQIGTLITRLATTSEEIEAAQCLRGQVFRESFSSTSQSLNDADHFDAICDHLLVIDTAIEGPIERSIVGTYRFLPQERAMRHGGFYTESEFALSSLIGRHPSRNFLELGRSCVRRAYRSKRTVELLWQGIWAYSLARDIDAWAGCASFSGAVPEAHALGLSFLYHYHRADQAWRVEGQNGRAQSMDLMPKEAVDLKAAFVSLPPLIKGYLRLGAKVGEHCVIDQAFGSTDVLIILPVEDVSARYLRYYGEDAQRFAA